MSSKDNSEIPDDYKEYFYNKFVALFSDFIDDCLNHVKSETELVALKKIHTLLNKLNYVKIMKTINSNNLIQKTFVNIEKNGFSDMYMMTEFSKEPSKSWCLMPTLNLSNIFLCTPIEKRKSLYSKIFKLNTCAFTYCKVVDNTSLNDVVKDHVDNGLTTNPFNSIGNVNPDMDINTMFAGVEVKNINAFEMLMESMFSKQLDGNIGGYMDNIKEEEVNLAADKLTDTLNNDMCPGNKQTTQLLSSMLEKIKNEVIELKNGDNSKVTGKQSVEQLLNIAQKVAGGMVGSIRDSNVNIRDLWDATSSLAKKTTNSPALDLVDSYVRSNIEANMGTGGGAGAGQNTFSTSSIEELLRGFGMDNKK